MLATVGDLVDDIVVRLGGPIRFASDTDAVVEHRRGGSAANVSAVAARISGRSRFLGQVGDDALGDRLLVELAADGVDVGCVRRRGRTGSIVVVVDAGGERSFLTDPGSARALEHAEESWLDDVDVLHVPLYSLDGGSIAATVAQLVRWARRRSIAVSLDLSSVSVIESLGVSEVRRVLHELTPDVVFANEDEGLTLGIDSALGAAITIVKRGAGPATVFRDGIEPRDVAAETLELVDDTTAAGDAFAAGFLAFGAWRSDPIEACKAGHAAAAALLRARSAG